VGQLDYDDITTVLELQARWMSAPERRIIDDLSNYLEFKRANLPSKATFKGKDSTFFSRPETLDKPEVSALPNSLTILSVD
jgi:hypothetical protein